MSTPIKSIRFDRQKHPGLEFDLFPFEEIFLREGLDHSPLSAHRVDFYVLLLITSGEGKHTIDFVDYPYRKGSVITIRKDQIHSFHPSSARGVVLVFTEEFALSHLEQTGTQMMMEVFNELLLQQNTALQSEEFDELLTLISLIQAEFDHPHNQHTPGIIRNLIQVLISKVHRIRTRSSQIDQGHKYIPQFLRFQRLVEEQCMKSRAVQFYADQLGMTPKTLNNITQKIIGKSPKSFIDGTLTLQVKRLLINSDLSIKEIAFRAGFEEPTNLFKFFKRSTRQTPQAFRASFQGRTNIPRRGPRD